MGHALRLICSVYAEANVAAFIAESNKKLLRIVVWDEKFKRNVFGDELTNSNAEAVGVCSKVTAGSVFKCHLGMANNSYYLYYCIS